MTVYTDDNGTEWYANLLDVTDLGTPASAIVGQWLETEVDPWNRDGAVDSVFYPLKADDAEQLTARRDILRDGTLGPEGRSVRVVGRRSGLHTH